MTISSAFLSGAGFAILFFAFVAGALLVIGAVAIPAFAVLLAVFWVKDKMKKPALTE